VSTTNASDWDTGEAGTTALTEIASIVGMVREIGALDTTFGGTGTGSEWYLVALFLVAVDAVAAFSNWTFIQREVHMVQSSWRDCRPL
jgi:hypothetical protein